MAGKPHKPRRKIDPATIPPLPPHARRAQLFQYGVALLLVGLTVLSLALLGDIDWARVAGRLERNLGPFVRGFSNPDVGIFSRAFDAMMETLYMAVIGTAIGGVLAVPLSFISAANLMGGSRGAIPGRSILAGVRVFPELLFAIIFVASIGPGAVAGIMALGVNSVGFLGKMFSDIIESVDPGPGEALRSTGATPIHSFFYAVIPQVTPEFASNVLYRFEINLRAASILGLVGAGGIGGLLIQRIQFRRWEEISMILIIIIAFVVVVDVLSSFIRRRLV
ncbi:MAG: phosphonate ABC transporter, permease protein PhnE [Trueperaceae bacterium]|nr:phosphonate ABC transporter, permease protein PhnE [Trueperaceae bacterium]